MNRCAVPAAILAATLASAAAHADDKPPLKIGVIAEAQAIAGASIPGAAQIAADEINAKGGVDGRKIELVIYDDHSASTEAVRAFQRLVSQDKVNAVIASYASEIVLALQPWAARLKTPMITPGAASNVISANIHKDYERNKYTFHGYITSTAQADLTCNTVKPILGPFNMKTTVILVEDAAWTKPLRQEYAKCLPANGLQVLDTIVFAPDTSDFTPIFNKIQAAKPDVITTGISHAGVQPTVQWKQQQVPIPMFGTSSQATNSTFWKETNGAADGVIFFNTASPVVAITPKTIPFAEAFKKRFGAYPSYAGYPAYDQVYYIAEAAKRAGSLEADKLVEALEKTDYEGTIGRIQFQGKDAEATHSLKTGPGFVSGVLNQWQDGKPVAIYPEKVATGKVKFPAFIKVGQK